MKKIFYSLILLLPFLFFCYFFNLNGFCNALPNYSLDSSSFGIIKGGLNDVNEFGLSLNGANLYTLPGYVDNVLDPYLYDKYGFDTEDIAYNVLSPLDPTEDQFVGRHVWSSIMSSDLDNYTINQLASDSFRVLTGYTPDNVVGALANAYGYGAKTFIIGKINDVTNTVSNVVDNVLIKLGSNFSQLWGANYTDLLDDNTILNLSSNSNQPIYSDHFEFRYDNKIFVVNFSENICCYTSSDVDNNGFYRVASICSNSATFVSGVVIDGNTTTPITRIRWSSGGSANVNGVSMFYGNMSYYTSSNSNAPFYHNQMLALSSSTGFTDAYDIMSSMQNPNYSYSYNYYTNNYNNEIIDISDLLHQLDGKYVTSQELGEIKDLLDSQAITNTDGNGAGILFDDDSLQELINKINAILNYQEDLSFELGDPVPAPDPEPVLDPNTGIGVPSDFPITTFDTLSNVISSPLEFFSVFEPVFMIFGSSTLLILGLWLFVPCVLIIAFIFKAFK